MALQETNSQLQDALVKEEAKERGLKELTENVCAVVHLLFKRISCTSDLFKLTLAFDDHVNMENVKVYLSMIEQRCMELICILKFIGLHKV